VDRRTALAFLIIGILTVAYFMSMSRAPQPRAEPAAQPPAAETAKPAPEAPAETNKATVPQPAPPAIQPASLEPIQNDIPLKGAGLKYEMRWSNQGACLRTARLEEFPQKRGLPQGVLLLDAPNDGPATLALIDPKGELPLDGQVYKVVEDTEQRLAFAATFPNGLRVTKAFRPDPVKKYDLLVNVTLENTGTQPLETQYEIVAVSRLVPEAGWSTEVQAALGSRYETGRVKIDLVSASKVSKAPFEATNNERQPLLWAGAGSRYFAAVLTPAPKEHGSTFGFILSASVSSLPKCDAIGSSSGSVSLADNVAVKLLTDARTLKPGESVSDDYAYFLGPKKQDVLEQYPDISGLLNYGFFGFVSSALLLILRALHHVIHNYGVGIILLTIAVKVCLHPMTRKGQIAMARMQKLQPLIKELQAKYKDDRQRQGREMMDLYRKHNANPMSGCWPMLFQLPILWGLFQMLNYSIDLRQQPFLLWVSDLSKPDTITHWGGFSINVLPVLMTVCSLVQQLTMPKPADPQQAQTQKMMMFMPVMFLFMFYSMASGLVLYWLTSTFLSIVEQKLIKLEIQRMEARGAFAAETVAEDPGQIRRKPKRQ